MSRKVTVLVRGIHRDYEAGDEQGYHLETHSTGDYHYRDGKHYIRYEDVSEDGSMSSSNILKIHKSELEHIKKGDSSAHMRFEAGKLHHTGYTTPMGELMVGVDTKHLAIVETVKGISVRVEYELMMNGDKISDSKIDIIIRYMEE